MGGMFAGRTITVRFRTSCLVSRWLDDHFLFLGIFLTVWRSPEVMKNGVVFYS